MLNLSRVIKPWKEADALSAHINLYGFWTETAFLTKSGDLGMVLSVTGVDYESLDNDEQQYAVKLLESALKSFGEGFHVYQYLFKTNRPAIPFARYDDELIDAAIDQRRQYFESKRDRLYEVELFYVIVLEGARSKTGILSALARMPRDPQGAIRELKAQFTNDNMKVLLRKQIDFDMVRLTPPNTLKRPARAASRSRKPSPGAASAGRRQRRSRRTTPATGRRFILRPKSSPLIVRLRPSLAIRQIMWSQRPENGRKDLHRIESRMRPKGRRKRSALPRIAASSGRPSPTNGTLCATPCGAAWATLPMTRCGRTSIKGTVAASSKR